MTKAVKSKNSAAKSTGQRKGSGSRKIDADHDLASSRVKTIGRLPYSPDSFTVKELRAAIKSARRNNPKLG
jgi:hypothetical protein